MNWFEYQNYLQSKQWKKIRKKVLKRDKYQCIICCAKKIELQIHHENYNRVGLSGEEEDCITLCWMCHPKIHNTNKYLARKYK